MRLNQDQLLRLLVDSVEASGWSAIVTDSGKPFGLYIFKDGVAGFSLRVFIWNCTHGGGSARAADEFRIQITGVVPRTYGDSITLLLGWHDGFGVFGAWDIRRHEGQDSSSPSAQIREDILLQAHSKQFSIGERANGEVVVAFRPELLVTYAQNAAGLHRQAEYADLDMLNNVFEITQADIAQIDNEPRRKVVATIVKRYRAADFRRRVLGAYGHRCAMCGLQLNLVDAAHIVPVAFEDSTDATVNGIALCKLHHAAFDRSLISFDERYRVEVSNNEVARLTSSGLDGGMQDFTAGLRDAIFLPNDARDYPCPELIGLSRRLRHWG